MTRNLLTAAITGTILTLAMASPAQAAQNPFATPTQAQPQLLAYDRDSDHESNGLYMNERHSEEQEELEHEHEEGNADDIKLDSKPRD